MTRRAGNINSARHMLDRHYDFRTLEYCTSLFFYPIFFGILSFWDIFLKRWTYWKVSNRVWHKVLISVFFLLCVSLYVLFIFYCRSIAVIVERCHYFSQSFKSGVLQGSLLSPNLFFLFPNDSFITTTYTLLYVLLPSCNTFSFRKQSHITTHRK